LSGATLEITGGTITLQNTGSLSVSGTNALKISSKISDSYGNYSHQSRRRVT
jgi:hypothetical protein